MTAPVRVDDARAHTSPASPRWGVLVGAWLGTMLIAAVIAMLLTADGDWSSGLEWEHRVLGAFDDPLPRWLDTIMLIVPWFGTNITLLPITIVAATWLYWRAHRADLARHLLVAHLGVFAFTMIGKAIFDRARPDLWTPRGQYAHASYPSGHLIASTAVLFTYAILLHRERGWRWPFIAAALILLVSTYSRLYLGVHWPGDVLAGLVMGVVWLVATLRAFPPTAVDPEPEAG